MPVNRVIIIVLDSVGIGALPDAHSYGDEKSNTLANVAAATNGLHVPNLEALGLGNASGGTVKGLNPADAPQGAFGRMAEASAGKDTTTGHWELAGIILQKPFPTYPEGFPREVISAFEKAVGRPVLGNEHASGTEIISRLGEEHMRTGYPIVYTSADSVFQIAAHEEVIPLEQLYKFCLTARELLTGEHAVGRVIARPFTGSPGNFVRTKNRKDYSVSPPEQTLLDFVAQGGMEVISVGKIDDIFARQGITRSFKTLDNMDGVDKILYCLQKRFKGLVFANLVDFDMVFGHRNDVCGYAGAIQAFDARLPEILKGLEEEDVLIITADHGCDPTFPGTDHTREYVPLLVYGKLVEPCSLGTRDTFADVAATVSEVLGIRRPKNGTSFAACIKS